MSAAVSKEFSVDNWIELTDFHESPKFPRHKTTPDNGSDIFEEVQIELSHSPTALKSKGTLSSSSYSPRSHSPVIPPSPCSLDPHKSPQSQKRPAIPLSKDVSIKSSQGAQYAVAPKDASLIGRIAHKAPSRKHRVLQPHEVFVELEELDIGSVDDVEWKETARWIKFEEDVEQDVGRWGRPHVSALAFHSLVDLRKGLEKGCILLDVEGDNFTTIVDKIVSQLVDQGHLTEDKVEFVVDVLYKRVQTPKSHTLWEDLKHAAKSADHKLHDLEDHLRHRSHREDSRIDIASPPEYRESINSDIVPPEVQLNSVTVNLNKELKDKGGHTDVTILSEDVLHQDSSNNEIKEHNEGHKLSRSMQELLQKIPDDAESLSVLVGGVDFLDTPLVVFVRLRQSHLLGNLTEVPIPVRFIYLTLGPRDMMDYHEVGRAMATLMTDKCFHEMAYVALTCDELLDAIDQFLEDSIVIPPGDWDQDLILPIMHKRNEEKRKKERKLEKAQEEDVTIKFSCKPCGGIINDLKTLVKRYPRDLIDVLHVQAFLAIFFVFISCIAPAIAFGGVMEEVTNNLIGETETLVGTGLCGVIYGLFAVQPLSILAFTGPLLLYEEVIIEFAHLLHIEYLPWRAWIGLWVMIILLVVAASELSFLVKYFTRFSEEIFCGVIVLFFIVEVGRILYKIFRRNPLCGIDWPCGAYAHCTNTCDCTAINETLNMGSGKMDNNTVVPTLPRAFNVCNQHNTSLWSLFLCFGTFFIAVVLRKFRQSRFLGKQGRRLVSDFGMLTAISAMVLVAYLLRNIIAVEILVVPDGWKPSDPSARGWVINPVNNLEIYHIIGAIVPAMLLATLIVIEHQLTVILVNKPEHKLMKGFGYHFDLCIVSVLAGLCGILGLPWHCAAPVRSIQHLQSLSYFSRKTAPGEKPQLEGVYEQRVTNIVVHMFILMSPFAYPLLREIPFAVLLGVFLYLAYGSFIGIQLPKRIKLLFMPPKHHPDIHYVRKVRTWKMNLFTIIQVVLVLILIGIKLSPAGMTYPLAIVLLIPVRYFMGKYIFSHVEMEALDSEEDFPEEFDEEGDFAEYEHSHVPY